MLIRYGAGTMKTYEPARSSAYGDDLRWRMVYQRMALRFTFNQISKNLGVDKSTARRTVALFKTIESVHKQPYPKEKAARKLTPPARMFILHLVLHKPRIYLHEIQKELEVTLLVEVSLSTLCTFLHKSDFIRQRMRTVALQQDIMLREHRGLCVCH